jgi:ATP-dependent DNA helicase RecQ
MRICRFAAAHFAPKTLSGRKQRAGYSLEIVLPTIDVGIFIAKSELASPGKLSHMTKTRKIDRVARDELGLKKLRPGQKEAVESLLAGRDTLVVMPTGAGKSAIYRLATTLLPGPTIVVSPLIALQMDQAQAINDNDDDEAEAAVLNSTLRSAQKREVWEEFEDGTLDFLFLAPEQFGNQETLERLRAANPSLFVVDEAHCVSSWGHDFRPDYLKLGSVIESLGHPLTLALTATAAPPVREEIVGRLNMREPNIIVHGFDRPNIHLAIECFDEVEDKRANLLNRVAQYVEQGQQPGIVYTATRKEAEAVSKELEERGVQAVCYHAGLKASEREAVQQRFMSGGDEGAEVIVATVAFGMGVDKPNVRFVFHLDISDSIDSYYQEIGRAGRDGEPSHAVLFYCQRDLGLRRFFSSRGHITKNDVLGVFSTLSRHYEDKSAPVTVERVRDEMDISQVKLHAVLRGLEEQGILGLLPDGQIAIRDAAQFDVRQAAAQAVEIDEAHQNFEKSRLEMMQGYAEARGCLRQYLLNYFGEEFEPGDRGCSNVCCTNCERANLRNKEQEEEESPRPFPLHARVVHSTLGGGQVMRYEADKMVVLFDETGYKTLGIEVIMENGLLAAA